MNSINFSFGGLKGVVNFDSSVGYTDEAEWGARGVMSWTTLAEELNMAKATNNGNLILASDYAGPVTPQQVYNAISVIGWDVELPQAYQAAQQAIEDAEGQAEVDGAAF
ncbi:TPA: hypothetical protein LU109_003627 [Enterobacter hormaechei subsp. xiangfangensis]|nr:hypothetical protein [Enterobacter hormaechei subsp. xiangfangensis]